MIAKTGLFVLPTRLAWLESSGGLAYSRLAIGAPFHQSNNGGVWLVNLGNDGRAISTDALLEGENGVEPIGNRYGHKLGSLGDIDDNGIADLLVGAGDQRDYPSSSNGSIQFMLPDPCPYFTNPRVFHSPGGLGQKVCAKSPAPFEFVSTGSDTLNLFLEIGPIDTNNGTVCRPAATAMTFVDSRSTW